MRSFGCLAALAIVLSSCGAGEAPGPTSVPPQYGVTFVSSLSPAGGFSPASSVVLYDQQFIDPFHNAEALMPSISPPPPLSTHVSWTSSDSSIVVQPQAPNYLADAPTAPPMGTFVATGKTYGKATVTAHIGAPVNMNPSLPVYHYPSLSFGCGLRYTPAFNFDGGSSRPLDATSDLYVTIGSDKIQPLDGCATPVFETAPGTPELWHTPYGGTVIAIHSLLDFPTVQASQWRNDATQFAPQGGVLLFKTKGGLIVKALLPIGPFEVSGSGGSFPY